MRLGATSWCCEEHSSDPGFFDTGASCAVSLYMCPRPCPCPLRLFQMFYVDFLVLQLPVMKIDVGHTHEQLSYLGYQVTVFPPVKQYFIITDIHLGKSCTTVLRFFFPTLFFTLIGVLEAKMEFSLRMRKLKKTHYQIETLGRNLSAYTQYSTALQ